MYKISSVPIEEINPADYNPRAITDEALEGLRSSIRQLGIVGPLIRNTRTNRLVSGHQRLMAAKLEGLKEVPVFDIDVDPNREMAINVVLNNPNISGHYTESLQDVISKIANFLPDFDLSSLRLDDLNVGALIVGGGWESDIAAIDKIEENLDGITSTIKVTCPQEIRQDVVNFLRVKLMESDYSADTVHVT